MQHMDTQGGTNLIAFKPRDAGKPHDAGKPRDAGGFALTTTDRMDIDRWSGHVHACGFAKLVIHERRDDDPTELDSFAGLYRPGTPWMEYCFARRGGKILVWHAVQGKDIGRFCTINDALSALLAIAVGAQVKLAANRARAATAAIATRRLRRAALRA